MINIFPLIFKAATAPFKETVSSNWISSPLKIALLPSLFKLFQTITVKNDKNLEEVDALLGASLIMFKSMELNVCILCQFFYCLQELKSNFGNRSIESFCSALFYSLNWFV